MIDRFLKPFAILLHATDMTNPKIKRAKNMQKKYMKNIKHKVTYSICIYTKSKLNDIERNNHKIKINNNLEITKGSKYLI